MMGVADHALGEGVLDLLRELSGASDLVGACKFVFELCYGD
tara:strand:+ start:275 stop:397 length:123 start_codon:yes stop_codon:yes gene_type:complete